MRSDARKKLTTDQTQQPYDTSGDKWADLEAAATEALIASRLTWGVHADRWGDVEWQRKFWAEAAKIALAPVLAELARTEAALVEAQRERDNALYEKGELAGLVGEADRAREQAERERDEFGGRLANLTADHNTQRRRLAEAERQVRETEARAKNDGVRLAAQLVRDHVLSETGQRIADFLIERADRALSGVSGPTTGACSKCGATTHTTGAHIAGLPADEPTRPTTEGASE